MLRGDSIDLSTYTAITIMLIIGVVLIYLNLAADSEYFTHATLLHFTRHIALL